MAEIPDRLLDKIEVSDKSSCWFWVGSLLPHGYGTVWFEGKMARAHRVIYSIVHDKPITGLGVIKHSCDRRSCVNPAHLEEGTQSENLIDMCKRNGGAKLKEADVYKIKAKLRAGELGYKIAEEFNVNPRTISRIKNGLIWSWIGEMEKKDG